MIELKYDTPVEVTEKQYGQLMNKYSGAIAGRKEENKFYIKLWIMRYKPIIEELLNNSLPVPTN